MIRMHVHEMKKEKKRVSLYLDSAHKVEHKRKAIIYLERERGNERVQEKHQDSWESGHLYLFFMQNLWWWRSHLHWTLGHIPSSILVILTKV